ncbi:LuxR C-terminal-related transcriptional regulator [Streptomyces sp. NPDC004647]|uniref:helix-turn-helix transcriptional regulator n=1 Tax=Streptomyces sp. NPDC004647 TaxID=3154671 RepID=UPI0033A36F90
MRLGRPPAPVGTNTGRAVRTRLAVPPRGTADRHWHRHRTPAGDPLLGARFTIPALPPAFVRRPRLLTRLDAGWGGPVTLVSGPAGAGKTVLAASWAAERKRRGAVVWLTTEPDNDAPGVFWAYVLEAFRHHGVPLGEGIGTPSSADHVDRSMLTRLAAAMARLPRPVLLVLDGFDRVRSREVAAGLQFVVSHACPQLRLLLTGRLEPLLPLHRYRAAGRLPEIRGADLAFTAEETALLLRRHGLAPSTETVAALSVRTEGWAAGLGLCALAARRADDPCGPHSPHGPRGSLPDEDAVGDFLLAEVLEPQPADVQDFLLRTSVLDRVHPELADAMTGRDDGARTLPALARANAFVERAGGSRWYRYHPQFAELLRTRLRFREAALEPELHRRAARWFADAERLGEALPHAVAAGDGEFAADLVIDDLAIGRLLTGPESGPLVDTLSRLPADRRDGAPGPALVAAACALAREDTGSCLAHLERVRCATPAPGNGDRPAAQLSLALIGLLAGGREDSADAVREDAENSVRDIRDLLEQLPGRRREAHPEIRALLLYGLASARWRAGDLAGAERTFREVLEACAAPVTGTLRIESLGRIALIECVRGSLEAGEEHARQAIGAAVDGGSPSARPPGTAHLALASAAADRHDLPSARHHLRTATGFAGALLDPVVGTESAVVRSRLELAEGNARGALAIVEAAAEERARSAGRQGVSWPWLEQRIAFARSAARPAPVLLEPLTDREHEVLAHAARMMSTREIAAELCLSANTVKTHLQSIYRKLSASRRGEAVRRALELGLLRQSGGRPG